MFESQVSTYLKDKILEHSTGKTSWTMPATTYLALYADDPTEDDTGTELTGITRPAITWGSASGGVIANSADATLTKADETTETCTHWGLRDALTGGNLLYFSPILKRRIAGDSTTEFAITNPGGLVFRYTYTGGTDPGISAADPLAGDKVLIAAENFASGNNGSFIVVDAGSNYFDVINVNGVAEADKTIGSGSLTFYTPTSVTMIGHPLDGQQLVFAAGVLKVRAF